MEKTNISWTDAEKRVLGLIKQNEESFLQYCSENWERALFLTGSSTVGWQWKNRIRNTIKPRKGDEILVVGRAIGIKVAHDSTWNLGKAPIGDDHWLQLDFVEKVRKLYRSKVERPKGRFFPGSSLTPYIKELLERGFVYTRDCQGDIGDYILTCQLFNLTYKDTFASRITARKAFKRIAIDSLCTIIKY